VEESGVELSADFVEQLKSALREAQAGKASDAVDGVTPQEAVERIVALRDEARRAKDWPASDRFRDALQRCGIEVKDSKEGTSWTVVAPAPS
jgi:cysteinyl-tRNA synthetase